MRRIGLWTLLFLGMVNVSQAQVYQWSGNGGNQDFFDENNWSEVNSGTKPSVGTLDP